MRRAADRHAGRGRRQLPGVRLSDPYIATDDDAGLRLVDLVRERLAVVPARLVGPLIAEGAIRVDGTPGRIAQPVVSGNALTVSADVIAGLRAEGRLTEPADLALDVLFEDDDVVVVDKPAGVHVHPMGPYRDDTLVGALTWRAGARPDRPWADWRPYPAHRLDRPTSGAIAFATSRAVRDAFQDLFEAGRVSRTYHAVVVGEVPTDTGTIDLALGRDPRSPFRRAPVPERDGGQPAVTHWRVTARDDEHTLLEVQLETGRTHQIRAHLAAVGHPIAGDELYADDTRPDGGPTAIALRAVRLDFPHPVTGTHVDVTTSGLGLPWSG